MGSEPSNRSGNGDRFFCSSATSRRILFDLPLPVGGKLLRYVASEQGRKLLVILVLDAACLTDGAEQLQHAIQLGQLFRHLRWQVR